MTGMTAAGAAMGTAAAGIEKTRTKLSAQASTILEVSGGGLAAGSAGLGVAS